MAFPKMGLLVSTEILGVWGVNKYEHCCEITDYLTSQWFTHSF